MEAAFGWVQQIWEFVVSLVPHLELLEANKGAVKFKGGGRVKVLTPGRYWYIPILTSVVEIKTCRQTSNLTTVVVPTSDTIEVAISPVVVYTIDDVEKALVETDDVDQAVGDVCFKAIGEYVAARKYEVLVAQFGSGKLEHEMSKKVRQTLKRFGVQLESCFFSELTRKFHRLIGDGGAVVAGEGDEE